MSGKGITRWNPERVLQVFTFCLLGATDEEIAKGMGVNINTINLWKRTHPEFLESMNAGKIGADSKVAASLYKRACGFSVPEVHVFMHKGQIIEHTVDHYYPPDSWACNKWLSIRQRTKWSEAVIGKPENPATKIENVNIINILNNMSVDQLQLIRQIQTEIQRKQLDSHNGSDAS